MILLHVQGVAQCEHAAHVCGEAAPDARRSLAVVQKQIEGTLGSAHPGVLGPVTQVGVALDLGSPDAHRQPVVALRRPQLRQRFGQVYGDPNGPVAPPYLERAVPMLVGKLGIAEPELQPGQVVPVGDHVGKGPDGGTHVSTCVLQIV